jgi:hypothetical protein
MMGQTMKAQILILPLLLLVGACATTQWAKYGASQQDLATDSYNCEKDARQSGYFGGGLAGALEFNDFQKRCMVAHGWREAAQGSVSQQHVSQGPKIPVY